jgi:hypothetical protein
MDNLRESPSLSTQTLLTLLRLLPSLTELIYMEETLLLSTLAKNQLATDQKEVHPQVKLVLPTQFSAATLVSTHKNKPSGTSSVDAVPLLRYVSQWVRTAEHAASAMLSSRTQLTLLMQ